MSSPNSLSQAGSSVFSLPAGIILLDNNTIVSRILFDKNGYYVPWCGSFYIFEVVVDENESWRGQNIKEH